MNHQYSDVKTILMSVKPSPDGIIRARNAGIDIYFAKPFRPSELRSRVESLLARSSAGDQENSAQDKDGPMENLRDRLKQLEGPPPFPATHSEILKLAKSEDASSEDIAEKIKLDPSLLVTVFKLVNSAGYGFKKRVDSLNLAVTLLGLEEVANLVMTAQIFQKLGDHANGAGLDIQEFWKHSVGTAFVSRAIARKLQTEIESAFLAGMLHDLGKIVLDRCFADYYTTVLENVQSGGRLILEAESDILGITHSDVGGQLASEWKFAENYTSAIRFHHQPGDTQRFNRLTSVVHLADLICRKIGYGSGGDPEIPDLSESVAERFHLGERGMAALEKAA